MIHKPHKLKLPPVKMKGVVFLVDKKTGKVFANENGKQVLITMHEACNRMIKKVNHPKLIERLKTIRDKNKPEKKGKLRGKSDVL